MKKMRTLLLFCLSLLLVLCLVSCVGGAGDSSQDDDAEKEPLTAEELFDRVDKKMDSYDSYESTISVIMNVTVNGYEINTTVEGVDIRRGYLTDNFEFYTEMQATVKSDLLPKTQTMTSIEAYYAGNYFMSNEGNDTSQKLYSPLSKEEAEAYAEEDDNDFFEYNDCVNKEFSKNDDGTWELAFSGYTAKAVNEMIDGFGLDTSMLNAEIVDAKLTLKADADFNATAIGLSFEFKGTSGGKLPEISVEGTFTKLNEAEIDPAKIDPEKYTQVADIRLLDEMDELIADRMEANEGEFTLTLSQTFKVMGESQQTDEVDHVVYGAGSDGFFYDIDAEMNGVAYDISYKNGTQSVVTGGQTQDVPQTEEAARSFIEGLIGSSQFDTSSVTNIKKISDNEYRFTCEPKDYYTTVFESMGATFRSVNQTVTFKVSDGKIVKIQSEVEAKGVFVEGNNFFEATLTVKTSVEFAK